MPPLRTPQIRPRCPWRTGTCALFVVAVSLSLAGCPTSAELQSLAADPGGAPQLAGTWAVALAETRSTFGLLTFDDAGRLRRICYQRDLAEYAADTVAADGVPQLTNGGAIITAASRVTGSEPDYLVTLAWTARLGLTEIGRARTVVGLTLSGEHTAAGFLATDSTRAGEAGALVEAVSAIRLSDNTAGCLRDDDFEDNDTAETAAELPAGRHPYLRSYDEDWYKLVVPAGQVATAMIIWDERFGSPRFGAFAENGLDPAASPFVGPGTYLLQVLPPADGIQPSYSLYAQMLVEDAYEENDTPDTAAVIGPGEYQLTVVDDDWFRVNADGPATIRVELAFEHDDGDLDLELYDGNGTGLAVSATTNDIEAVRGYSLTGQFLIRVLGYAGQSNTCRMTVQISSITEDPWEDNDTIDKAAVLEPGTYEISVLDDDWFRVSVGTSAVLEVTAEFEHDLGDIDLELYDAARGLLAVSLSTSDLEIVNGYSPTGEFLIHVYGYAAINRCTLTIKATPVAEDEFEENDTRATAALIEAGTYTVTVIDEDWFRVAAGGPARIEVTVTLDPSLGDVDLELFDAEDRRLAVSATMTEQEYVSGTSETGEFFVRLHPYSGANVCTMTVTVTPL